MAHDTKIRTYTRAELKTLLDDPVWWETEGLPFTKARLSCYLDNPFAEDDDVLWLIAWQEGKPAAYLGLVPDQIRTEAGTLKIAWFSSWWADPRVRGSGLARQLTSLGLTLYKGIGIDSGTPWSMRQMRESGDFFLYTQRPRSFWFLNVNQKALKDFGYRFKAIELVFPIIHFLLGRLMIMRLRSWLSRMGETSLSVEYLLEPDAASIDIISSINESEFCVKDAGVLRWRSGLPPRMARIAGLGNRASYFGNSGEKVSSSLIKLSDGKKPVGLVNICLADGYLKIPFLYLLEGYEPGFAALVGSVCLAEGVDVVYSQNSRLRDILNGFGLPRWLSKSYPMDVLLSSSLRDVPKGLLLQDGDGAF